MASPAEKCAEAVCDNFYCALVALYDKGGVGVLAFLFIAIVFYRLVWKVWSKAMESKDGEIERLIEERNFYQRTVLPHRLTSNDTDSEDDDSEHGGD